MHNSLSVNFSETRTVQPLLLLLVLLYRVYARNIQVWKSPLCDVIKGSDLSQVSDNIQSQVVVLFSETA